MSALIDLTIIPQGKQSTLTHGEMGNAHGDEPATQLDGTPAARSEDAPAVEEGAPATEAKKDETVKASLTETLSLICADFDG